MANEKRLLDADAKFIEKYFTKRLIDAQPIVQFIMDGLNNPNKMKALGHDAIEILAEIEFAPTVDAVSVEDLERILSTTQGLELWDYQKRGIMSAVCRLCGKEKNDG